MIRTIQIFSVLLVVALSSLPILTNCFPCRFVVFMKPFGQEQRTNLALMAMSNGASEVVLSATRRQTMHSIMERCFMTSAFISNAPKVASALDMDAFMNSELEADTKNCDPSKDSKCIPKLSSDEAMCKYGQSGEARGEACRRVKELGGALPKTGTKVKSLGGAYAM